MLNDLPEPLEWRSVLNAVQGNELRRTLVTLDERGVVAYTDGACLKNPGGPAGWSALLWSASDTADGKVREGAPCLERYGHIPKAATTTNNRAEIAAVLAVLSLAPPTLPLLINSDSEYTIKVAQGTYQMKANPDLWDVYRTLMSFRKVAPKFVWVRGHAGQEHNERADELAGIGAYNGDRAAYERWQASQAPEAHNAPTSPAPPASPEIVALRQKVQKLETIFSGIAPDSSRVSSQERSFIRDMAKNLQQNKYPPTEKQRNWVNALAKKHHVE